MTEGGLDYDGVTRTVTRPDIHAEVMKDLGLPAPVQDATPLRLWDGVVMDPAKSEEYATSFSVKNLKG
jgi:hypothetical protein